MLVDVGVDNSFNVGMHVGSNVGIDAGVHDGFNFGMECWSGIRLGC